MINLDDRYHSYLGGNKKMRIDGIEEQIRGYGWEDDGTDIVGYYVTTENYQLHYSKDGVFLSMEALAGLAQPVA